MKTIIVESQRMVLDFMSQLCTEELNWDVVAAVQTGRDAIRVAQVHGPELVILDLSVPDIDESAVIAAILALRPGTRIVGLGRGSEVHPWGRTRKDQLAGFLDRDRMTTEDLRRAFMALGQAA